MKKIDKKKIIIIFSIVLVISFLEILYVCKQNKKTEKKVYDIKINLKDVSLNEINSNSKKIKYKDNELHIYDKNEEILSDIITIKGRGNTTWKWDKKPYQIEFKDKISLLGLGESNKYVLLANYVDETLLRNHIASFIAKKLNMEYVLDGINVNLYVDDIYQGMYYITNKVEIGKGSVDLKDDSGILVELDNAYYEQEDYHLSDIYKDHLVLKDVKNKKNKKDSVDNFIDKYNSLEDAVYSHNWDRIIKIIDIESLAKHHIVYELTHNGDAYGSSFFMYMDGKNDLIHFGPIWDFDIAFNNNVSKKVDTYRNEFTEKEISEHGYSRLFSNLVNFPEFKSIVKKVWYEYMDNGLNDILKEVEDNYLLLNDHATKNIEKWNYSNTYREYIDELIENIKKIYDKYKFVIDMRY